MAVLSMKSLPLGFRFRPTDEELINHYLRLKINGRDSEVRVIPEVDVCKWEPWDLPGLSVIKTEDPEWFFFCPRDRKYPNGQRSNRATDAGYWKATGKDRTIKSRRSNSNTRMIGMKKTLVFYRGRAPKGERTHWIMHEYRPTEKDLDGTGPGQCAFLLFRLFRKPDEKAEADKYDETEPTGSSPTTTKFSPDDTSSDAVQEIAMSDLREGKQSEGITSWLTENFDNITSNAALPVDSCSNSYMAFDWDDHVAEETVVEAHPLNCKVFSPLQSHIQTELTAYVDSPYASDFGYDHNGLHFQDGNSEQDVSLTELLDGVFNNQDEFSCEESTFQKNSIAGSGIHLSGLTSMFQVMPLGNTYPEDNGSYSDIDSGLAQEQYNPEMGAPGWFYQDRMDLAPMQNSIGSLGTQISPRNIVLQCASGSLGDNYVEQGALSAGASMGSFYGGFNNVEDSSRLKSRVNYGGDSVSDTGIKIRSRPTRQLPNRPSSGNIINQGTAPRRIRLQVNVSATTVCNDKVGDTVFNEKVGNVVCNDEVVGDVCSQEDKGESIVNEVKEEEHTPIIDEPEKGNQSLKFDKSMDISEEFSSKLRLRGKRDGELGCGERGLSSTPVKYLVLRGTNSLLIYTVSASLVLILVVLGCWKCFLDDAA